MVPTSYKLVLNPINIQSLYGYIYSKPWLSHLWGNLLGVTFWDPGLENVAAMYLGVSEHGVYSNMPIYFFGFMMITYQFRCIDGTH